MNKWFTVGVRYTKQQDDGTFKRVSEPYLLAAMTHADAENRIYDEIAQYIRGEFIVTKVAKTEVHDIFPFDDSDVWFKVKVVYESATDEDMRPKKHAMNILVAAHTVKEAYERTQECLKGLMVDYFIPEIKISPIVDIFPYKSTEE